jgi:hypothetical protein
MEDKILDNMNTLSQQKSILTPPLIIRLAFIIILTIIISKNDGRFFNPGIIEAFVIVLVLYLPILLIGTILQLLIKSKTINLEYLLYFLILIFFATLV